MSETEVLELKVNIDFYISLSIFVVSCVFFFFTKGFEEDAAFFPKIILVALGLTSLAMAVFTKKNIKSKIISFDLRSIFFVIASFAYVFSFSKFGFLLPTVLFFVIILKLRDYNNMKKGIFISLGTSICIYYFFSRILFVPLPRLGSWF